jgi:hypothetical protein
MFFLKRELSSISGFCRIRGRNRCHHMTTNCIIPIKKKFDIKPIGTVAEDIEAMMAGK